MSRLKSLSRDERAGFDGVIAKQTGPREVTEAAVLDAVLAWLRYTKFSNKGVLTPEDKDLLDEALHARAKFGTSSPVPAITKPSNRPDGGHNMRALSLGSAWRGQERYATASARLGYHELLDDPQAYEPNFGMSYLKANLALDTDAKKILPPRLTLVEGANLRAVDAIETKPSWRGGIGYNAYAPELCRSCREFDAAIGGGYTVGFWGDRLLLSELGEAIFAYDSSGSSIRPGFTTLMLTQVTKDLRAIFEITRQATLHLDESVQRKTLASVNLSLRLADDSQFVFGLSDRATHLELRAYF